jgi:hypothetical protein
MKHIARLSALAVAAALLAFPQTSTKKTASSSGSKKTAAKAPAKAPVKPGGQKTASRTTARKGTSTKKRTVAASPPRQQTPTPDRYREIQQALIDKGYLKSEANGQWDAQSTDALRQFQNDQKLAPTGKINAPSLIGLGLGHRTAGTISIPAAGQTAPGQTLAAPVEVPPAPDVLPVPDAPPAH